MDLSFTILNLAGAIALLLWGVRMVQTGVQRAFGPKLRRILASALSNRFKAFAAGLGATAILQSSTATGLMITGFAAGGLVDLVPALAVMLGANVGTTLIVQFFSFDAAAAAAPLILFGVLLFRRTTAASRDFGRVLIGLGLMFMALRELLTLVTPYEDQPSLRLLLGIVATQPLVDVVLAAALTWAAHSSVAIVLLVMSFAARGVVPPDTAFALVLGANLGTALNPCLEGAAGEDPAARRLPFGNLLTRVVGVLVALMVLAPAGRLLVQWQPNVERAVADFHVAFNLAVAVVFLPLLPNVARLLRRLLPERVAEGDPSRPLYLDRNALEAPFVALGLRDARSPALDGPSRRHAERPRIGARQGRPAAPRRDQETWRRYGQAQRRRHGLSDRTRSRRHDDRGPPPRRRHRALCHEHRARGGRGRKEPARARSQADQARARAAEGPRSRVARRARSP